MKKYYGHIALLAILLALAVVVLMPARPHGVSAHEIQCASQLNAIGKACYMYMNDHDGMMPPNLEILIETAELNPKIFICPCSGNKKEQNSFIYRGADLKKDSSSAFVVAYDKKTNRHKNGVRNILFADGHVKKYSEEVFAENIAWDNELRREAGLVEKPAE